MHAAIIPPASTWRPHFLAMLADFQSGDPVSGTFYHAASTDFSTYVLRLQMDERGVELEPGQVACSHRWLLVDDALVAVVRVRHNILTPYLSEEDGHVGYDVAPSWRRRGYGIAALQAGLAEAHELNLPQVLVCADTDNLPSWRTIEHGGGVLECEKKSAHYGKPFRRYWIALR
jgi:predicted acetyltransferase